MRSEAKKKRDREYSRQWRKDNPDKIKAYLERTKDRRKKAREEYAKKNRELIRQSCKNHYIKNREDRIRQQRDCKRRNGYAYDKTPERRERVNIRKQTGAKYPLADNKCNFCTNKATQHHHTTEPMTIDDFDFVCDKHHNKSHGRKCVLVGEGVA